MASLNFDKKNTVQTQARTQGDEECRLRALPAELRNAIYELSFTTNDDNDVDLFKAAPPSKSLLLTCHEIYREARLICREAYRQYWTDTDFAIYQLRSLDTIRAQDLKSVTKLALYAGHNTCGQRDEMCVTWRGGIWTHWLKTRDAKYHGSTLIMPRHEKGRRARLNAVLPPGKTAIVPVGRISLYEAVFLKELEPVQEEAVLKTWFGDEAPSLQWDQVEVMMATMF